MRAREELTLMATMPPAPPPPMLIGDDGQPDEPDHDDHYDKTRYYSTDLLVDGIRNNRNEEDRLTETEKNERVQRQLMVSYKDADIFTTLLL